MQLMALDLANNMTEPDRIEVQSSTRTRILRRVLLDLRIDAFKITLLR